MSEMVDRVARAIESEMGGKSADMALAAIAAMREPTEAMKKIIADVSVNAGEYYIEADIIWGWQAMIDEALR